MRTTFKFIFNFTFDGYCWGNGLCVHDCTITLTGIDYMFTSESIVCCGALDNTVFVPIAISWLPLFHLYSCISRSNARVVITVSQPMYDMELHTQYDISVYFILMCLWMDAAIFRPKFGRNSRITIVIMCIFGHMSQHWYGSDWNLTIVIGLNKRSIPQEGCSWMVVTA